MMKNILKKIDEFVAAVLKTFAVSLCIAIGLILFARVIIRFSPLIIPMAWSDEVVEWMMAWMIFTGATLIMRDSDHFKVELLQDKYGGKKWVDALNVFIALLGLAFFSALFHYSLDLTMSATWFSPILKVSRRVPYAAVPFNCALIIIYQFRDLVKAVIHLFSKKSKPQQGTVES